MSLAGLEERFGGEDRGLEDENVLRLGWLGDDEDDEPAAIGVGFSSEFHDGDCLLRTFEPLPGSLKLPLIGLSMLISWDGQS